MAGASGLDGLRIERRHDSNSSRRRAARNTTCRLAVNGHSPGMPNDPSASSASKERGSALVVGATGIVGQALGRQLVDAGRRTYGLSRSGGTAVDGVEPVAADLLDSSSLAEALRDVDVNSATVRNVLAALGDKGSLRHVGLSTGLKHYLGTFDDYATGEMPDTPFHETSPAWTAPTSTMPRKTSCTQRQRTTAPRGACTGSTRS